MPLRCPVPSQLSCLGRRAAVTARQPKESRLVFGNKLELALVRPRAQLPAVMSRILGPWTARPGVVVDEVRANRAEAPRGATDVDKLFTLPQRVDAGRIGSACDQSGGKRIGRCENRHPKF